MAEIKELKLKTEKLPTRCEICHQADLFDPTLNQCQRCLGIKIKEKSLLKKALLGDLAVSSILLWPLLGMMVGLVVAGAYLSAVKYLLFVSVLVIVLIYFINRDPKRD